MFCLPPGLAHRSWGRPVASHSPLAKCTEPGQVSSLCCPSGLALFALHTPPCGQGSPCVWLFTQSRAAGSLESPFIRRSSPHERCQSGLTSLAAALPVEVWCAIGNGVHHHSQAGSAPAVSGSSVVCALRVVSARAKMVVAGVPSFSGGIDRGFQQTSDLLLSLS